MMLVLVVSIGTIVQFTGDNALIALRSPRLTVATPCVPGSSALTARKTSARLRRGVTSAARILRCTGAAMSVRVSPLMTTATRSGGVETRSDMTFSPRRATVAGSYRQPGLYLYISSALACNLPAEVSTFISCVAPLRCHASSARKGCAASRADSRTCCRGVGRRPINRLGIHPATRPGRKCWRAHAELDHDAVIPHAHIER